MTEENHHQSPPKASSSSSSSFVPAEPRCYNTTWKLISQGAEARVWFIPNFLSINDNSNNGNIGSTNLLTIPAVCKERFPKSYRHVDLDASITKSRTKSEARCLVKCQKAGVACPTVLAVSLGVPSAAAAAATGAENDNDAPMEDTSTAARMKNTKHGSCLLFLEFINGCTVRQYLDERVVTKMIPMSSLTIVDDDDDDEKEPHRKRFKYPNDPSSSSSTTTETTTKTSTTTSTEATIETKITRIDQPAQLIAFEIGYLIASMHNAGVVHGDLTTSNIMIRNPISDPTNSSTTATASHANDSKPPWKPKLVLIDFGLGTNTASSSGKTINNSVEEKAVDLYVLERSFEATHAQSESLVSELFRSYKQQCTAGDAVLQRLSQVRLRGRKRECFG